MNKKVIILISIVIVISVIAIVFGLNKFNISDVNDVSIKNPLNATYNIQGVDYTLVNGKAEREVAPGSASKEIISVFGEPVYGDLNGDGVSDAVMYLTQETGGSGTFFYVVEAINDNGFYRGTNAMYIGDRIAPQNINIEDGRAVVNFADRNPGESFSVRPSLGKSIWVHLDVKNMQIGEWVKDFEGESNI